MAGIYFHIPFCNSKCSYCGFYSIASQKQRTGFVEALKRETVARKSYLRSHPVSTIYFGGGTPSLLSVEEIRSLLDLVSVHYDLLPDSEITLEANPDTLSFEYLDALRRAGVNRLSIGIQSFFDDDLKYLGRRHDSAHAKRCLAWAKDAGFDNLTIDLIYGLPTSDAAQWDRNLDCFFDLGIPHLSAYALTLEPNAILPKQIELGEALPVDEEDAIRDYGILCRRAQENGFLHYEISNFCRPCHLSRHNTSYWNRTPYIGIGPSAHSFDGASRQWNLSHMERYIREAGLSDEAFEREELTKEQAYDEYVMLKLRTIWGIDLKWMQREMGERFSDFCQKKAKPLVAQGKITQTREFLYLNDTQMLYADGVAEALFWE